MEHHHTETQHDAHDDFRYTPYIGTTPRSVHGLHYREVQTAHSLEPYLAKDTDHPSVHFHTYEDFPPDFYKAEFYEQEYAQIMGTDESEQAFDQFYQPVELLKPYEPLKVHSFHDNGFYYYDDNSMTSFKDDTGYEAYAAGHHANPHYANENMLLADLEGYDWGGIADPYQIDPSQIHH